LAALTAELKPAAQPVHAVIAQLGDVQHEADVRTVVSQLPLVRVDAQLPKAAARDWDHQADLQVRPTPSHQRPPPRLLPLSASAQQCQQCASVYLGRCCALVGTSR
jgi:hypothetical protein